MIRIRITADGFTPQEFNTGGQMLRMGRDPSLEAPFSNAFFEGKGVSWQHAVIRAVAAGYEVADMGSSFGTMSKASGKKLEGPEPIKVGDQLNLGPNVTVTVVELSGLVTPAARQKSARSIPAIAGGIALIGLLAWGVWWFASGPRNQQVELQSNMEGQSPIRPETNIGKDPATRVSPQGQPGNNSAESLTKTTGKPETRQESTSEAAAPGREEKAVSQRVLGQYLVAKGTKNPPALLMQQQTAGAWVPLSHEDPVLSGHPLVALPGSRCSVVLKTGVRVDLIGCLPEFAASGHDALFLESALTLEASSDNQDATLLLHRGRFRLSSNQDQPTKPIQLLFENEHWEVAWDPNTEVFLEYWQSPGKAGSRPMQVLGLFTTGKATIQDTRANKQHVITANQVLAWSNTEGTFEPVNLKAPLTWASFKPDLTKASVLQTLQAMDDWQKNLLSGQENVAATLATQFNNSQLPVVRRTAVLYFAALDYFDLLVKALEDRADIWVRNTAVDCLLHWVQRDPVHARLLLEKLQSQFYCSPQDAQLIVQLLRPLTKKELELRDTTNMLVRYLEHRDLKVRQIAYWHLDSIYRSISQSMKHDPVAGEEEERKKAVEEWKRALEKLK